MLMKVNKSRSHLENPMYSQLVRTIILLCLLSQLVACGQKGNLYLPETSASYSRTALS